VYQVSRILGEVQTPTPVIARITSFGFTEPLATGTIDDTSRRISVEVPFQSEIAALSPTIEYIGNSLTPHSGWVRDFTRPVVYSVGVAGMDSVDYQVVVSVATSDSKKMTGVHFDSLGISALVDEFTHTAVATLPFGTNRTHLAPSISTTGVSVLPASGAPMDFSSPVEYVVTAANGTNQSYWIHVNTEPALVQFDLQGADFPQSVSPIQVLSPDIPIGTLPSSPTNLGFYFGGWFTPNGQELTASSTISSTLTVTAQWNRSGTNWSISPTESGASWNSVAFGNGIFVATSFEGAVAVSTDGVSWTLGTIPEAAEWVTVTYGGDHFVAISGGYNSTSSLAAISSDGLIWTVQALPSSDHWISVAYGNGTYMAIAYGGSSVASSVDGIHWTPHDLPQAQLWTSVAFGAGKFVAVGWGTPIYSSSDQGVTWSASTWVDYLSSIAFGNNEFWTADATSVDGATWRGYPGGAPRDYLCFGNGVYVKTNKQSGNLNQSIMVSIGSDAMNPQYWLAVSTTFNAGGEPNMPTGLAFGNHRFVIVNPGPSYLGLGYIATSP
jgi:hypothetical protein